MDDDTIRQAARTGLAPLLTQVPTGPEWDDLAVPVRPSAPAPRRLPAWLVATTAAATVLAVVGAAALLLRVGTGTAPAPVGTVPNLTAPTLAGGPSPEVSPLPAVPPAPLRIVAIRPNDPSVAVIDLEEGTLAVYPPGVHALGNDAVDGAVITPRREIVIWSDGVARLFGTTPDRLDRELRPERLRDVDGLADNLQVVPGADGRHWWLVQAGTVSEAGSLPTLVELVRIDGGAQLLSTELAAPATAVAATATGLVVNVEELVDTGDGFVAAPGTERVIHLLTDGEIVDVGPGRAIAAGTDAIVRVACGAAGCDLWISAADGSDHRAVARPGGGEWAAVGGPLIPSTALPFQTVAPDGAEVLMAMRRAPGVTGPAWLIVAVDMATGASRTIAEGDGQIPLATWSADGAWIALITADTITVVDAADPGAVATLAGVIPAGHFPIAAG